MLLIMNFIWKQRLAALAQHVPHTASMIRLDALTDDDPLAKVKGIIQDTLAKSQDEAGAGVAIDPFQPVTPESLILNSYKT